MLIRSGKYVYVLLAAEEDGPMIHYMGALEIDGSIKQYDYVSTKPDDCITIMHTSGTSGFPKGVMISEKSFRSQFKCPCQPYHSENVLLSYRPLAWGADRNAIFYIFLYGGTTGFFTDDLSRLMEEIALVRPTSFTSSPSIWNKIYSEFKCELSLAINQQQMDSKEAEQQLFNKFSKLIPNRCKTLSIGGAMVSPVLLSFITRCYPHCLITESYGSTECGAITYDNSLCPDVDYRLESVFEMGYTIDDKPFPRGELLIKSIGVFLGYVNNLEETKAAITDDGYFRTGDIVELRSKDNGRPKVHVIDRKKNFLKLANGQFVAPEFLQSIYIQSPFIEQIYIHGDPMENCVTAVIVPNKQYAEAFIINNNLTQLDINNPDQQFVNAIVNDIRSIAIKESLGKHEIPFKLVIDFAPFTAENGLLTSSLKLCRQKIALHYADRLKDHRTIEERINDMLETATGQQLSLDKAIDLMAIGGHSLAAVRMSRMIQDELGVNMPLDVLFQSKMSLEQLANFIKDPSQISSSSDTIFSKLQNDAEMELNITIGQQRDSINSPSTIFITGTTGFVGAFLLSELLATYPLSCKFICLVRCHQSSMDPFDRIYQNMYSLCLWKEEYRDRIIPLKGDLAEKNFGLDQQMYENLAEQIDIIFHCGAIVNFVLPYSQLYGSNVFGTREIIHLACHTSSCIPVHYISTTSVLSIDTISSKQLGNGYAQSKWVAEKLIEKASRAGLFVVTYRLGLILADSETGACNRNDFYTLLIAAIMKIKCYPAEALTATIKGTPANIAARKIVDLSRNTVDTYGDVYEIVDKENMLSFDSIFRCLGNCGLKLESVTFNEWRNRLLNDKISDPSLKSIGEFLSRNPFDRLSSDSISSKSSQINSSSFKDYYIMQWLIFLLNNVAIFQ